MSRATEVLFVFDGSGGGCCATAKEIRAAGTGLTSGLGKGRTGVVLVLPDGVRRISIRVPYQHPVTLTAAVQDNVAAFYAPGIAPDGSKDLVTWYGPAGDVLKRFTGQAF